MKTYLSREIYDQGSCDVVVAGGGVAGCAAALSAARCGMRTLLIEKSVLLGGLATLGLITWYEPLCDGRGTKLITGIAEELLHLAIRYGYDSLPGEWGPDVRKAENPTRRYTTLYSPTAFSLALMEILTDHGVTLRLDTLATHPVVKNGHCEGVVSESKTGAEYFGARVVIDATGDADLFDRAGCDCVVGKNFLTYTAHCAQLGKDCSPLRATDVRGWMHQGSRLDGTGHPAGMKYFHGVTGEEVTEFVLIGQQMLLDKLKAAGRDKYEVTSLPGMAQFRTTRHILGAYTLTGSDAYRHHSDSVGVIGDFRKQDDWYEVPFRTLYSAGCENLLAAGRIVSAEGDGWEVTRVIPAAVLTGQAAGEAAALAIREGCNVADIDIDKLQSNLQSKGVQLRFPL